MKLKLISITDRLPYPRRMPKDRNECLLHCVKEDTYNRVGRLMEWHLVIDRTPGDPYDDAS